MAEPAKTFDFDIQPSTTRISGNILPDGEAEVTFQVRNSGDCSKRAEVIIEPRSGPTGPSTPEELAYWLQLVEPPEYDYQPQSHRNYTVRIKATAPVVPGRYSFRLLLVGHDDPDRECMASDEVSFNVVTRRVQLLPFVIGGIVLLLLLAIGIIVSVRTGKPSPALKSTLSLTTPMKEVTVGQPVVYRLSLQNVFAETVTEDVVMEYTYPAGIVGGWAEVAPAPISPAARCGSSKELLRCVFEKIEPQHNVDLMIYVLPGPPDPVQDISIGASPAKASSPTGTATSQVGQIDNSGRFTLHWKEKGTYHEDLNLAVDHALLPLNSATGPTSGAAIPAVNIASVGLPVRISLVGWNNATGGGPVSLEYELPPGMRFLSIPDECKQQAGDYFVLRCDANSKIQVEFQVIALQPSAGYPQILRGLVTKDKAPSLAAANNALVFNGRDEWSQLGYSGFPDTKAFTVEMWVNPYSLEDGQALIGAHRQSQQNQTVLNQFLVGYYNGSINVNVLGECQNLVLTKTSDPFHLAVVVRENVSNRQRDVTVYKDGKLVEMQEKACCEAACLAPQSWGSPAGDAVDLNWVIGQDWDPNGSGIIASDFFHGAISDVRIYAGALTDSNVKEDMSLPPSLCKPGPGCDRPDLIGWWPLASSDHAPAGQGAECILPKTGEVETTTATEASCVLVDLSPNHRNGARSGGTWENKSASFGDALVFNGGSTVYLSSLLLSTFEEKSGTVKAASTPPASTLSAPPPPTSTPTSTPTLVPPLAITRPTLSTGLNPSTDARGEPPLLAVKPGEQFNVTYDFTVRGDVYHLLWKTQLVTGLVASGADGAICEDYIWPWLPPLPSGSVNVELTAPTRRGTYDVVVGYFHLSGCADALSRYSRGEIKGQVIGRIRVAEPPAPTPTLSATEAALSTREAAVKATETALKAAVRALTATPTPLGTAAKTMVIRAVPVTISAWVYVDTAPSQQQTIVAANFTPGGETETVVSVRLTIASDGHVRAIYEKQAIENFSSTHVRDEKAIPVGRWIHYAVVLWFDKGNGTLIGENLLLFRDGELVKTAPSEGDGEPNRAAAMPDGFYLGGLGNCDTGDAECFTGRIDEVRIWNRALYDAAYSGNISPEIDFWRRLPGVAFDEYAYWSFDNRAEAMTQGLCPTKTDCAFDLTIQGPAWAPNDLSIDYTE